MHDKNLIFESPHWKVILLDEQKYLGRCVVVLKRKCGDLAELEQDEILDFFEVVRKMESLFRKTFDATMFNWACLMNNAYRETPPDPQVHWHFRPRYNHKVEFEGEIFEDPNFGSHYLRGAGEGGDRVVSSELQGKIVAELKKNLEI
jgi:diadenosine tetraphosphate (Ap4A) HIT family hydrolase